MAVLGLEDRRRGCAWLECSCCGEQSEPVELYDDERAVDVLPRPSKRECYRCEDDGCECVVLLAAFAAL